MRNRSWTVYYTTFIVAAWNFVQGSYGLQFKSNCSFCPGDVLTFECSNIDGGSTIWEGSAFQCEGANLNYISLRHSQFSSLEEHRGVCNNGAIVARAIGVDGNNYTSQLNVTVAAEMNNKTVECVHDYNFTLTVTSCNIIIVEMDMLEDLSHVYAHLINVSHGQLTFEWNPILSTCSASTYYVIGADNCGHCPNETHNNFANCDYVYDSESPKNMLCNFAVGTKLCNSSVVWAETLSITLQVLDTPEFSTSPSYMYSQNRHSFLTTIIYTIKKLKPFNMSGSVDGSALSYTIVFNSYDSGITCGVVIIAATLFTEEVITRRFEISSESRCSYLTDISVTTFATNSLGDGPNSTSLPDVIEAINNFFYVEVDLANGILYCVLENDTENSSCVIQALYNLNKHQICDVLKSNEKPFMSKNVSISHLPPNKTFCFGAEATFSSFKAELWGNFSTSTDDLVIMTSWLMTDIYIAAVVIGCVILFLIVAVVLSAITRRKLNGHVATIMNNIRTYISRCIHNHDQQEVIYAHVETRQNNGVVEYVLDDDRIEYAQINHSVYKKISNRNVTLPKPDETDNPEIVCNLDNLLIQLRSEVTHYWYQLGSAIGINQETLEKYSKYPPEECIIEVLDYWLRYSPKKLTWNDVAMMLKKIGLNQLSENLFKVYQTGKLPIEVDIESLPS